MLKVKDRLIQVTMLCFGLFYLVTALNPFPFFRIATAFLLVAIICQSMPAAKTLNRYIAAVLFALGGILLMQNNASAGEWVTAVIANSGLVMLFIVLPLLSFPLAYDDYDVALRNLSRRYIYNELRVGGIYGLLTMFLGSFLNMGVIPIVFDLFHKSPQLPGTEKTLFLSIVRGMSAAIYWAPNYIAMAIVLSYLDIKWIDVLPMGIVFSLVMLLLHWLTIRLKFHPEGAAVTGSLAEQATGEIPLDKTVKLTLSFLGLIVLTALANILTDLPILVIIPILALTYPIVLAAILGKIGVYRSELRSYLSGLGDVNDQVIIFAAAGFFGKVLEISGAGQKIPVLLRFDIMPNPSLAILVIILLAVLFALFGVHGIVTITALAASVSPADLGISLQAYAFTLLAAYSMAVLVSPFSGTNLVLAGLSKKTSWELGIGGNWLFCMIMTIFFVLIIPFIP